MKRNALMLLGLVFATGLIAAGCGDDDESSDTGTDAAPALTKEEYLAKGNAICEKGNAEIQAAFETALGNQKPTQEQLNAVVTDSLIPSVQGQIDDLRAGIPEADSDQVNEILDKAELTLQDITEDPSLATQEGGADPFAEINKELDAYGLTTCAN